MNVLAEKILSNHTTGEADHHIQEVLTIFPSLQYGMDVNPKFTGGPTGVEYTLHLNAFDLLHIELVHGWLLDPQAEEYELIGQKTYNQLVNVIIEGNDAASTLQNAETSDGPILPEDDALSTKATQGMLVKHFLDNSGHQLTQYGLTVLHDYLKDGQMMVFFRNNHFNTLTKHGGMLYLLVTDFGYAKVSSVVWEKLDVIDGDTEYVNAEFATSPSTAGQNDVSNSNDPQAQSDYQLALQLSRESSANLGASTTASTPASTADTMTHDADLEAAQRASVEEYNRLNPDNPILIERASADSSKIQGNTSSLLSNQLNILSQRISQAGTSMGASLQDVASSAANMIQPAGLNAPSSVGTAAEHEESQSRPSNTPQPTIVNMDLPTDMTTQEVQDMMLAMQLQQEEDSAGTRQRDAAVPAARTGLSRNRPGQKENCVIS